MAMENLFIYNKNSALNYYVENNNNNNDIHDYEYKVENHNKMNISCCRNDASDVE